MTAHKRISRIPVVAFLTVIASCASTEPKSDLNIDVNSDEIRVSLSEDVARGLVEGLVGADLDCTSDIDSGFEALLEKLEREGPRSRGSFRDGETTITARRHGGRLDLDVSGNSPGRIEATMPWAVAECLLGHRTTVDRTMTSAIRVKVINPDGRNFSFKLD